MTMTSLKRHWLQNTSNIPIRYQGWDRTRIMADTGKFPEDIDTWLEEMLAGDIIKNPGGVGFTGVGLLFDGGPGEGKTTHAVVSAIEFIKRLPTDPIEACRILGAKPKDYGRSFQAVHFITFPEFLAIKKRSFNADADERKEIDNYIEGLHGRCELDWLNVRLLIIDDLGKEFGSQYNDSSFDELLRSRYDKGLPTIVTTNVMRDMWATQYSAAMGSFAFEAFRRVRIANKDLRKTR